MAESSEDKIKEDLKRINQDFNKEYVKLRKEILCLE